MSSNTALSNTAYVILGFLQRDSLSGYDIKQKIDGSTRFFFTSSYGQIYPELKKLEAAGLIEGSAKSQGQRARTEYAITSDGQIALDEWLASPGDSVEMRDEGLLKLFFMTSADRETQIARIKSIKAAREVGLAQLRQVQIDTADDIPEAHEVVLEYGLELYELVIDWADRTALKLESTPQQTDAKTAAKSS